MDLNNLLVTGMTVAGVTVPGWALIAGGVAVLFVLFALMRRPRPAAATGAAPSGIGTLALLALVAVAAGAAYFGLKQFEDSSRFVERRALEDRTANLLFQANQPGSVLGCLNVSVTPLLDEACEKQIFAEPGRLASAVGMTAERIALLADATNFAQREPAFLDRFEHLRRSLESDPYGLVAHVFAIEHKCIPDSCTRFRFLKDTDKIKANLTERKFDGLLAKYSPAWANTQPPANASVTPPVTSNETKDEKDTPPSNETSNAKEQPASTPVALPQTPPMPPVNTAKQKAPQKQQPAQQKQPPPQAKRKGPPEPVGGLPRVTARGNQNAAPEEEEDDTPTATPAPPAPPSIFQRR